MNCPKFFSSHQQSMKNRVKKLWKWEWIKISKNFLDFLILSRTKINRFNKKIGFLKKHQHISLFFSKITRNMCVTLFWLVRRHSEHRQQKFSLPFSTSPTKKMVKSDVFPTKFEKIDNILYVNQVFVVNGEEKLQEIWEKAKK